jgi:LacI family transcriptional regulator, gluconate utilization system Gnt-I transcriptional repressor
MTSPPIRSRATGRITLTDVARLAGVSPMTVSRALRRERAVDPALVERVEAAAAQLGYFPDPAARALASRHSNHVAVLIPLLSNSLFVDLIEAVQRTLRPEGFQMLMGVTQYDPAEEALLLREQLQHRPAGLMVTGFDRSEATRDMIAKSGLPCVHLMEATDEAGIYSVGFSQRDAGAELTRHLLSTGRRRIAFAAAQLDARVMQRREGWRQEMQARGLYDESLELLNPERSSLGLGGRMLQALVDREPAIDAVFFCNDDLAQGALLAALRLGIDVPGRIAIAGFNDLMGSDQMMPALTTIRTPRTEIGVAAAHMLLALIRGEAVPSASVNVGYRLMVRDSA